MPIEPLDFGRALAIGMPIGAVGYAFQTLLARRRRNRRRTARGWGPTLPAATSEEAVTRTVTHVGGGEDADPAAASAAVELEGAELAAADVEAADIPVDTPTAPRARPRRAPRSAADALRRQEAGLAAALDAVIAFVDVAPRRQRAVTCADELSRRVPRSRRGPATVLFIAAVADGLAPTQLQLLAEESGVEVATALKAVRTKLAAL